MPEQNLSLPEDITTLSAEDLAEYKAKAKARGKELYASDTQELAAATAEADELESLAQNVKRVELEEARRTEAATSNAAKRKAAAEVFADGGEDEGDDEGEDKPVTASGKPKGGATTKPVQAGTFKNPSLADAANKGPQEVLPREESVFVASADIPGLASGTKMTDIRQLTLAMQARARRLPVTSKGDAADRYTIASLERNPRFMLGENATMDEISDILKAASDPNILVAAGGWCAPSEISYDLFNIVCEDGMLDMPTVGINRGGIRWPISPSFADVVDSDALWTWTETQDIAAATGTAQSGTKSCGRVPCVEFDEERLHCDGICLTVGNLTQDAYPELIDNFQRLLMVAHARKINRARINELRTLSAGFTVTNGNAGEGVVANVLGALELQAIDYRERYSMCQDAVLEVIAPRWLRGPMRSDLRRRMGAPTDTLSASDAMLMALFDAINVRIQWVSDYQLRTAGYPGVPGVLPTAWPDTVEFMMMAPGTAVLGTGLRLDLGIIRDSVLNQTNDFTAAWMEECWLIFQPGHEIRRLTVNICPDGTTGANDLVACGV